ncbi:MAG: hypothetical protein MUP98_16100 [Candidatus Aminicenantes bacterium]|nr:hypothetical protein [Candidatus Aminicenantes bacterium]
MKKTILEALLMAYSVPYPYFSLYPHQIPCFPIHPLKLQYMRRARIYLTNAFHLVLSPLYQNDAGQL